MQRQTSAGGGAGGLSSPTSGGQTQHLLKQRKAPIKIEPKVFFANERTFLAWMHISIILAGASIAILAFADENENPASQLYGIVLLPVAMAFIVYSMYQCTSFNFFRWRIVCFTTRYLVVILQFAYFSKLCFLLFLIRYIFQNQPQTPIHSATFNDVPLPISQIQNVLI